ncbi:unnamed protein product, partial [Ectocarpus fasciculatus]
MSDKPTAIFSRTSAPVAAQRRAALRGFWADKLASSSNTGPFVLAATAVGAWHGVLLDAFRDWLDPLQPWENQAFMAGRMLSCGYLRFPLGPRQDPSAVTSSLVASAFPGSAVAPTAVAPTAAALTTAVFARDREHAFRTEVPMSGDEGILDYEAEEEEEEDTNSIPLVQDGIQARELLHHIEGACPDSLLAAYHAGVIRFRDIVDAAELESSCPLAVPFVDFNLDQPAFLALSKDEAEAWEVLQEAFSRRLEAETEIAEQQFAA